MCWEENIKIMILAVINAGFIFEEKILYIPNYLFIIKIKVIGAKYQH